MSEFRVEIVRVGPIEKHPNADTLSITKVYDYPVILKTGEFKEGDLAIYVPVDAVVPKDDPRWAFLEGHNRIRAKRLRGIFSMGLLTKFDETVKAKVLERVKDTLVGEDVADILGIKKYEPPEPLQMGGDNEHCPFHFPRYTDIEGYRRWPDVLAEGELVVVTEKIHGANGRYAFHQERFWAGSRTSIKKPDPNNLWWKVFEKTGIGERLKAIPGVAVYGEVFGQVQDLKYGAGRDDLFFRVFDMVDLATGAYYDWDRMVGTALNLGLEIVPVLYQGPWKKELLKLAEGKSQIADHMREGCVIRPVKERFDPVIGRVILKHIGEDYLLRKGGTEYH